MLIYLHRHRISYDNTDDEDDSDEFDDSDDDDGENYHIHIHILLNLTFSIASQHNAGLFIFPPQQVRTQFKTPTVVSIKTYHKKDRKIDR